MDFHLKQWRNQQEHESEEQQPYCSAAKIPKLEPLHTQTQPEPPSGFTLPLFVPEPNTNTKATSTLSAFSESHQLVSSASRFPRMGSFFSISQWQELELQAMIFQYMLNGHAVPPELLQPIKRSLVYSQLRFHHSLQQYPTLLQSGYWGRGSMDPEPSRCRRTDGKKWRCSRDVVAGQKYCERHVHRGRNRSRKPVEVATATATAAAGRGRGALDAAAATNNSVVTVASSLGNGTHFGLSGSSPSIDLLQLNHSSLESRHENRGFFDTHREVRGGVQSDSHVLRPFFDDWPGQLQEHDNGRSNGSSMNSATSLSISIRGNTSSDVSLKLSTGNEAEAGQESEQPQLNWPMGWGSNHMASMGGPLAEALRSSNTNSNSNSSPTSVLHQLPRVSISETSFIST